MNTSNMNSFLSEGNIKRHLEHLRTLRLQYSILLKSYPELIGREIKDSLRLCSDKGVRSDLQKLYFNIKSHELFFDSFYPVECRSVDRIPGYSSPDSFLYDLLCLAKEEQYGFAFAFADTRGDIKIALSNGDDGAFIRYTPLLALDLYEHSYFNDYGFDKERYVRAALTKLDISRLFR